MEFWRNSLLSLPLMNNFDTTDAAILPCKSEKKGKSPESIA